MKVVGLETNVQVCGEPVRRFQFVQKNLVERTAQLVVVDVSSEVRLLVDQELLGARIVVDVQRPVVRYHDVCVSKVEANA